MSEQLTFYVLLAPAGQLTGNGQLRETISERRNRKGADVAFWYLSPDLVKLFEISDTSFEAVVADEITAINWVKLRFGGKVQKMELDILKLRQNAMELPPPPFVKDISVHN